MVSIADTFLFFLKMGLAFYSGEDFREREESLTEMLSPIFRRK